MRKMKKYDAQLFELVEKKELAKGIFDFRIKNAELSKITKPGQFVHIAVPGKTLRRPISVCDVSDDCIRIVFRLKGEGTEILSQAKVGDMLDVIVTCVIFARGGLLCKFYNFGRLIKLVILFTLGVPNSN